MGRPSTATTTGGYRTTSDFEWEDRRLLLRAGRMNLPYGLRSIEHTAFIHTATRNDLNAAQQHGVALAYNGTGLRGEAMLILGNFQLNPDAFRERGYSAYAEWAPSERAAIGASSKITYAARDLYGAAQSEIIRHAHGAFGRVAAYGPLVLLGEADLLVQSRPPNLTDVGYTAMLQADVEVWRGLHLMATGEIVNAAPKATSASLGAWGSVAWFFAPHADVRSDFIYQSLAAAPGPVAIPLPSAVDATTFLVQLHVYL
jgi:hypothetical protein